MIKLAKIEDPFAVMRKPSIHRRHAIRFCSVHTLTPPSDLKVNGLPNTFCGLVHQARHMLHIVGHARAQRGDMLPYEKVDED